jgi:2-iminobutanoate/2-iminopropanoate deaminase
MAVAFKSHSFGMPWEKGYGFSQAVQVGPILYVSGQLSHDMDARFIGEGDFDLQVRTTFANLDRILKAYGARREQVVQTTVYVKDLRRHFEDIARLHAEYFGDHRPTSTVLGVVELALPEQLVEIAAVAAISEQPRRSGKRPSGQGRQRPSGRPPRGRARSSGRATYRGGR